MKHKFLHPLFLTFVLASGVAAQQKAAESAAPDAGRLRAHVTYLASDKLEGRQTGTPAAEEAARYIAGEFARHGLAPGASAGARARKAEAKDFLQAFPYVAGVALGKDNSLSYARVPAAAGPAPLALAVNDLRVGEDWMPLGFSANARVEQTPVVFVGYGIASAEQNYDDYAGTGVAGKVALALAGTPDGDNNPHSRFTRAGELRFKAAAARAAGARALVVVAGEDDFKNDRLSRLAYDNSGGDAGLPVVVVARQAAAQLLGLGGVAQLAEFERKVREWKSQPAAGQGQGGGAPGTASAAAPAVAPPLSAALGLSTDIVRSSAPAYNVVGVLDGSDPQLKDEVIVVGAHYDHLGRGGRFSLSPREGEIHHGADDNASGTAGLLELARLLSPEKTKLRRTVVLVAFGGEEEGLLGSNFYVNNPARPLDRTVAMINMDMIGRLRDERLMIGGVGTAAEWRGWVGRANSALETKASEAAGTQASQGGAREGMAAVVGADGGAAAATKEKQRFALSLNDDGFGPSDHSSFYAKRVPVLFFFTGSHEDYHKPTDTADRLNYEGEARILSFVRDIVVALQESPQRPTFVVARTEARARSTSFSVYLGTIPNYGEGGDGLKLDGVRENSPAAAAGLKAGDLIVRMAGSDVRNVYDYTQALSGMKAGQEYEVEIVRDGQRRTLKVTPAARK